MIYLFLMIFITTAYLLLAIFYKKQNFTSPLFINNIVWFFVAIFGLFFYKMLFPLTIEVFITWLIWIFITNNLFLILTINSRYIERKIYNKKLPNYWPIIIIISLFFIKDILKVGLSTPLPFLLNLRLTNISGEGPPLFLLITKLYPLIFSLFLLESLINTNKKNLIALIFIMGLYALMVAGKFTIIFPIISYLIVRNRDKKISFSKLLLISLLVFIIVLAFHFFRMSKNDQTSILEMLAIYIYSPLIALGEITTNSEGIFGENIFRFFYALTYKLNLSNIEPTNTILEYHYVPIPTNVYTVMYPFYKDLNILGVIMGSLFYGLFFSIVYNGYFRKKIYLQLIYAALIPILMTSFFAEQFFTGFSEKLQTIIYCIIIGWAYEKRKN